MKPHEVSLFMTSQCTHNCVFCLRFGASFDAPNMSLELVSQILEKYPTIRSACLAGFGEPFMNSQLNPIIHYLMNRGIFIGLITNGSLITEHIDLIEDWQLGYLSVSLNAANSQEHRDVTGARTWSKIREGLDMLHVRGIRYYLSFVLEHTNFHRIGRYIETARRFGASHCVLHNAVPQIERPGDSLHNQQRILTHVSHGQSIEAWKSRYSHVKDLEIVWPELVDPFTYKKRCQSIKMSISVDGNGHFSPCRRCVPPSSVIGNVFDTQQVNAAYCEAKHSVHGRHTRYPCQWCFGNTRG